MTEEGERRDLTESAFPFNFSLDPPRLSLDIIRCSLPDRLFDDSSEIMLALRFGRCSVSSGGPSSKKSMRSRALLEIYGFEGFCREDGVCGIVAASSSSSSPSPLHVVEIQAFTIPSHLPRPWGTTILRRLNGRRTRALAPGSANTVVLRCRGYRRPGSPVLRLFLRDLGRGQRYGARAGVRHGGRRRGRGIQTRLSCSGCDNIWDRTWRCLDGNIGLFVLCDRVHEPGLHAPHAYSPLDLDLGGGLLASGLGLALFLLVNLNTAVSGGFGAKRPWRTSMLLSLSGVSETFIVVPDCMSSSNSRKASSSWTAEKEGGGKVGSA